uniref:Putative dna replication factor cdt1 n=1 Tax=Anopheles marajoara TaxID=58244 RepID=A0A2M4C5Q8_9DIPT
MLIGRLIGLLATVIDKVTLGQRLFELVRALHQFRIRYDLVDRYRAARTIERNQLSTEPKASTHWSAHPAWWTLEIVAHGGSRLRCILLRDRFVSDVLHAGERIGDLVARLHLLMYTAVDRIDRHVPIEARSGNEGRILGAPGHIKVPLVRGRQLRQYLTVRVFRVLVPADDPIVLTTGRHQIVILRAPGKPQNASLMDVEGFGRCRSVPQVPQLHRW